MRLLLHPRQRLQLSQELSSSYMLLVSQHPSQLPLRTIQEKEIQIKFYSLQESWNATDSVESESTYEVIKNINKEVEIARKIKEAGKDERSVINGELEELKTSKTYGLYIILSLCGLFIVTMIVLFIVCLCKCK